ncbi:MAG TPA: ABC transporter permease, partial [Longimicrobiales bacterium]|nr:ABC transporter permease [Longimicrobiales bacterium]
VRLVTRTIQDLYFVMTVRELLVSPAALGRALALGVLGTMLAALPPAWEAARTHPRAAMLRSVLESGLRARLPAVSGAGVALMAAGGLVLALSSSVDGSFAGLFGVIIGAALLTPAVTLLLMRFLRPAAGALFGVLGRMAATGVTAGLSRTGPAIAALTIAVSVSIGIGVMVDSFRGSLVVWLQRTLAADLYVAPVGSGGAGAALDPRAVAVLEADPAVAEVRPNRRVQVSWGDETVELLAAGVDSRLRSQFDILAGDLDRVWADFVGGDAILASEPFVHRYDVGVGDTLVLRTAAGPRGFLVGAVFRDYGSDRGMLMMSHRGYLAHWNDPALSAVALNLRSSSDAGGDGGADAAAAAEVAERLRVATAGIQALEVRPNARLRAATLQVFDRTFAITRVLRALALVVAFVGVLSALMALQLERSRELGVLRANGMTPGQVWGMVASQTGLIGAAAGLMALPLGVLLAVLMIEFVNRRSFGWTMDLAVAPGILVQGLAVAVGAALLAGLYPSWRMARTSPAEALRSE